MYKQLTPSIFIITILIVSSSISSAEIDEQTERQLKASLYSNRLDIKTFMKVLRTYLPDRRTFRTFNLLVNQHCSCGGDDGKDKKNKKNKKTKLSAEGKSKRFYKSPYIESKSSNLFKEHILLTQQR